MRLNGSMTAARSPLRGDASSVISTSGRNIPEQSDGYLDVAIDKSDNRVVICFKDGGVPFNPLERPAPDAKLSWKRRRIGGLGIFLVIKKMDDVRYAYVDNKNVLTVEKIIVPKKTPNTSNT